MEENSQTDKNIIANHVRGMKEGNVFSHVFCSQGQGDQKPDSPWSEGTQVRRSGGSWSGEEGC